MVSGQSERQTEREGEPSFQLQLLCQRNIASIITCKEYHSVQSSPAVVSCVVTFSFFSSLPFIIFGTYHFIGNSEHRYTK